MIKNYLKVAFRSLLRQKSTSLINILGLAVGLACGILILMWIQHELSYDRHHEDNEAIHRLTCQVNDLQAAIVPAPMPPTLAEQFPEVESAVRLSMFRSHLLSVGDQFYEEDRILFADSNFFDLFAITLIEGSTSGALDDPQSVLISAAMAEKYFGTKYVLGKTLKLEHEDDMIITGVFDNSENASHLDYDFLMPMRYLYRSEDDLKNNNWDNFNWYGYVKLKPDTDPVSLEERINDTYKQYEDELEVDFMLQPVQDIHLKSTFIGDVPGGGNMQYIFIFSVIAIFILLIACINFMNLSTARSARRAREVGFRKVAGARRGQLIRQFLVESVLVSFISLSLALLLVSIALPFFNEITDKSITWKFIGVGLGIKILVLVTFIGLLSGSYPAIFLSGITPVRVFNLQKSLSGGSRWFRDALVVTQFIFSIILIAGTIVVRQQQQFIREKNLGFDRDNLLYISLKGDVRDHQDALKNRLEKDIHTSDYSIVSSLPTNLLNATISIDWPGKDPNEQVIFSAMGGDENMISVFDMQMVSGRAFEMVQDHEKHRYILNEKAVEIMDRRPEDVVGETFNLWGNVGSVVGVVQDFHFKPIVQPIEPLVIRYREDGEFAVVRAKTGTTGATIEVLESINNELNPNYPFDYGFIDQDLDNLYQSEERLSTIVNLFAIIAILISCMGLYGLSAFLAEQRKKEVGVRKVVGASVFQLGFLLSRDFTRPIWIAMVIALPLAYYFLKRWLEHFAYHMDLSWMYLVGSCLIAYVIANITVSFEVMKAALANPIKALRTD